jgi:hypothetical protein
MRRQRRSRAGGRSRSDLWAFLADDEEDRGFCRKNKR